MNNGHSQHFWEMAYLTALHGSLTRVAVAPEIASQLARAHADEAAKKLEARVELLDRIERNKPRDMGS